MSSTGSAATSTPTSIRVRRARQQTWSTFTSRSSKATSSASDAWSSRATPPPRTRSCAADLPRRGRHHGHGNLQAEPLQARPARLLQVTDNPTSTSTRTRRPSTSRSAAMRREERRSVRRRLLRRTGFFVQTQFSTRNFLGEGENLGLSFQRGSRQNFFSLSYADPGSWTRKQPRRLHLQPQHALPGHHRIRRATKGGTMAYGYRLHRFDSFSFVYVPGARPHA